MNSCTLFADRIYVLNVLVQFATVEKTWQRFSHFECVSSLCIVMH